MKVEDLIKGQELLNAINRLKVVEMKMGVEFDKDEAVSLGNLEAGLKVSSDMVIGGFFPYASRDLSEEHYAAIKKACNEFIENCQAMMTKLRKEKEQEFAKL